MSRVYLVRHGKPALPAEPICIGGGSDPALCAEGEAQARALQSAFAGSPVEMVYTGGLKRAVETAGVVAGQLPVVRLDGADEIGVGVWEGLPFAEIRARWPEVYGLRGADWSVPPPGGEAMADAAARLERAVLAIAAKHEEAALVTHDGLIRSLLWQWLKLDAAADAMPRQPYGSVTVLTIDGDRRDVTAIGKLPADTPTDEEIEELWERYDTPEAVRKHCRAVCGEALRLREGLLARGIVLSHELLRAAALTHDLCRANGKTHPADAARILRGRGYLNTARVVAAHHDAAAGGQITEEQVLMLADTYVDGATRATIDERFAKSLAKCGTEEAKRVHEERRQTALAIERKVLGVSE